MCPVSVECEFMFGATFFSPFFSALNPIILTMSRYVMLKFLFFNWMRENVLVYDLNSHANCFHYFFQNARKLKLFDFLFHKRNYL